MKKIIDQYRTYFEPLIIIAALIIAMLFQGDRDILFRWATLSILWGLTLWKLKNPNLYYVIFKDKAFLCYLIFICWATFHSFTFATEKSVSIIMLIPFVAGLLSYFVGFTSNETKAFIFYRLLLAIGLALVIYTCYQSFVLGILRPTGVLQNWNTHAALLAIIFLPWIMRYALKPSTSRLSVIYWSAISFLFAFAMGLTLSRGVSLIFVTGFLGLIILAWRQKIFYSQSVCFVSAIILGYVLSSFLGAESIVTRFYDTVETGSVASLGSGRHLLWSSAWHMYLDRPFFGWGLSHFFILFAQYKNPLSSEVGQFAHNDYLQILVELGPIGLIILIGFVVVLLKRLSLLIMRREADFSIDKKEACVLLLTCTGLLIHTFFTFHIYQLTMQIIFGYYLGQASRHLFAEYKISGNPVKLEINQKFTWLYRGFCMLIILTISLYGLSFYYLERAKQTQNQLESLDYFSTAGLFFPALGHYESVSAKLLLTKLKELPVRDSTLVRREQIANIALSEVNRAIVKRPLSAVNYLIKAEIIRAMHGAAPIVIEQYEQALKINPFLLVVRRDYANYLVENHQYQKAQSVLWEAWGRVYIEEYQKGLDFLSTQLKIDNKYANSEDSLIIERGIGRLRKLMKAKKGGKFVFS